MNHQYDWTPLHAAAQHGYEPITKILMTHGADIHARDQVNYTHMHKSKSNLIHFS